MIELTETINYVVMILVAAGVGAIGGLASELLLVRREQTGTIELPGRIKGTRLFDIGFPAGILVGAIAAAAMLYFFPPTTETVTPGTAGEAATTTVDYDLVKLVALSLIVGSAGPRFLAAAQARVLGALEAQKAETAVATGGAQVDHVADAAKAAVPAAVESALAKHVPEVEAGVVQRVTDDALASLSSTIQPQVTAAHSTIQAIS